WSADLVILEFALEGDAGDAKRAGGARDVALVLGEDLADVARLEVGARRAQIAIGGGRGAGRRGRGRRGGGSGRGAADLGREALGEEVLAGRSERDRAFDFVLQLADVAGPRIALEQGEGVGGEIAHRLVLALRGGGQEARGQQRDVPLARTQRGQRDGEGGEPVVEVLAK